MIYCKLVRFHKTLRGMPAMGAGVTDKLREIGDIAKLSKNAETALQKRGPYKKRAAT